MREIRTWRDPYDAGFTPCRPKVIQIKEGLTILVGCNGAGKTTLLNNIESELKKAKVPVVAYDNLNDGGTGSVGEMLFNENYSFASALMSSSEGECIGLNMGKLMSNMRNFVLTGHYRKGDKGEKLVEIFMSDEEREKLNAPSESRERWILLDATDSGYSVDNVIELKDILYAVIKDGHDHGMEMYIVISANEYELAAGESCLDVNTGKYLSFDGYEAYRRHILESRKRKDKRAARATEKPKQKDHDTTECRRRKGWDVKRSKDQPPEEKRPEPARLGGMKPVKAEAWLPDRVEDMDGKELKVVNMLYESFDDGWNKWQ